MAVREPPQVLRIKRKRTEDPLQALVFEESKRRIKRPKFVFKLQRTEENDIQDSTTLLNSNDCSSNSANKPVFNLPKRTLSRSSSSSLTGKTANKRQQDDNKITNNNSVSPLEEGPQELNPDLLDMLNDYLKNNDETKPALPVKPPKRRQSSVSQTSTDERPTELLNLNRITKPADSSAIEDNDDNGVQENEYVYDVYYRDKAVSTQWENERIGYIKFDDDDLDLIEEDDSGIIVTDDEDSNDENFYRNDYPDDEDGGYEDSDAASLGLDEPSDDQDDEFDILTNKRRFSKVDFKQTEGLNNLSADEIEPIKEKILELPDPWHRLNRTAEGEDIDMDVDMDAEEQEGDGSFKRNIFFDSDNTDPLAIHRDKIFGRLQNMIQK